MLAWKSNRAKALDFLRSLRGQDWTALLWVSALAFVVLASYGIVSGTVSALVTGDNQPSLVYIFGVVAVAVTCAVVLYARAAARWPIGKVLVGSAVLSALALLGLLLAQRAQWSGAALALYVWKDVYIVVLIELFWTLANAAFKQSTAKWAYGFFCVVGTLGTQAGTQAVQALSQSLGPVYLLWLVLPVLLVTAALGYFATRACGNPQPSRKLDGNKSESLISVVRGSRNIQLLLGVVLVIQIATTLIDYSYLTSVKELLPGDAPQVLAERAAMFAQVETYISFTSLVLQLTAGILTTLLGVRLLVLLLPIIVGACAIYYAISPLFTNMILLKVANKAIDYSLFRTSKELLYQPLSYAEKTQGKAAVDVFGYRIAKGGASLVLVSVAASALIWAAVLGIALWLVLGYLLVQRLVPVRKALV